ncbi:MAG: glycosyl hydrolase family 65 protein [Sphingomonas sp.]
MGRKISGANFDRLPFGRDPWRLLAEGHAMTVPQLASVFTIGNGFIGIRGPGDAAGAARVYLNGVYEIVPIPYHEAAFGYARESDTRLAVADATRPRILVDGAPLPSPIRVELDMAAGCRIEHHEAAGLAVTVETLASMDQRGIVAIRVSAPVAAASRITVAPHIAPPPDAGDATGIPASDPHRAPGDETGIEAIYDPRLAPGFKASPWHSLPVPALPVPDGNPAGNRTARADALSASGYAVAVVAEVMPQAIQGDMARFDCFASYAAERANHPLAAANTALDDAQAAGFDGLAAAQRDWFAAHWQQSAIAFSADFPLAEQALRHALFELVQAVGRDGKTSIGAKGQSGEGYEGHVFWDADLYVLPVFAFTRPDIARAMLAWRISGLDAARDNARALGQATGALYPWRTIGGRECSSFFPAGSAQYHINADIAYALQTYVSASGDRTILADGGAAMLVETARIWLEIGFHDAARDDAFVINRVTGPDEYSAIVDNNLYTNLMAARHLRFAAEEGQAAGLISAVEAGRMYRAADKMLLPFDEARGIYLQDEGFFGKQPWPFANTPESGYPLLLHHHPLKIYRHQVAKQADAVLAVALMPEQFEPAMRGRMLDAYEAVTVHDSTLSASAFAIAAARAGDGDRAVDYWQVATLTDLANLFANTDHGLHMAALAGSWSTVAFGFAGISVDGDVLRVDPLPLPALGRYSLRIMFHGSLVEIAVDGDAVCCTLVDGQPVSLSIGGGGPMMLDATATRDIAA